MSISIQFDHKRPRLFLSASFAVFIGLMLAITTIALLRMGNIGAHMEKVVQQNTTQAGLMMTIRTATRERLRLLHSMLNSDDPFEADEYFMSIRDRGEEVISNLSALERMELSPKAKALLEKLKEPMGISAELHYEVIDLVQQQRKSEARLLLITRTTPAQDRALDIMDSFIRHQKTNSRAALLQASDELNTAYTQLFSLTGLAILLGTSLGVFVVFRIGALVDAHRQHSHQLSNANQNLELEVRERRTAEEKLHLVMGELEQRVAERTAELSDANKALTRLASYDSLTKLPNRALFKERLKMALAHARRNQTEVALLFMDLDGFKQVNDLLGHEAGDRVLQETARRLCNCIREEDTLARMGGDEFTVILGNLRNRDDSTLVASKLIHAIDAPYDIDGTTQHVGISIGISTYPDDSDDMDTLLQHADDAMYNVKRSGKNNYLYYSVPESD
ncbi:MAG: diguanylate cyclase [Candidatus Sedimenticola sp. 20ELBAFRAG]